MEELVKRLFLSVLKIAYQIAALVWCRFHCICKQLFLSGSPH